METAPAPAAEPPPPPAPPSSPVAQVGDNFQEVDGTPAASSDAPEHDNDGGEESDVESRFGGDRSCASKGGSAGEDEEEYWSVAYWNHGGLGGQYLEEYQRWVEAAGFRSGGVLHAADKEASKETSVKGTSEEEGRAFWAACLASCYPSP